MSSMISWLEVCSRANEGRQRPRGKSFHNLWISEPPRPLSTPDSCFMMSAIRLLSYGLRNMVADSKDDSKNKVLIEADTKNENRHWDWEQATPHTTRIGGRRFQGGLNDLRQVATRHRDAQKGPRNKKVSIQSFQLTAQLPNRRYQNMFSLTESLTRVTDELYGRSAVQKWKCTQGKAKPWRRNTFLGNGGEIKGIPSSFLRRYAGFGSSHLAQCKRNCKRRRFELKLECEAQRELDDVTGKSYE